LNEYLDLDETWTFSSTRLVIAGQYTNIGSISADDPIVQSVSALDPINYFVPANADFNSDTVVDSGDYVMWRKNSGITSGAVLGQGDANGDGAVDGVDYDAWRSQYNSPALGGGTEAAAGGERDQAISFAASSTSTDPSPSKVAADASDVALGAFVASDQRTTRPGRSLGHARSLAAMLPRDWTERLNDLAERRARRGDVDESAVDGDSRATVDPEATDDADRIDCSVTKSLAAT
jgi:hypothetical protein